MKDLARIVKGDADQDEVGTDRNTEGGERAQEKISGLTHELDVTQQARRSAQADEKVTSGVEGMRSHEPLGVNDHEIPGVPVRFVDVTKLDPIAVLKLDRDTRRVLELALGESPFDRAAGELF
jgi:hypothetical protein